MEITAGLLAGRIRATPSTLENDMTIDKSLKVRRGAARNAAVVTACRVTYIYYLLVWHGWLEANLATEAPMHLYVLALVVLRMWCLPGQHRSPAAARSVPRDAAVLFSSAAAKHASSHNQRTAR